MNIIERLKLNNPNYKAGYLNPWCVSCGVLGPKFPTQQFIEIGCEYRCSRCVDAGKTNFDAMGGILDLEAMHKLNRQLPIPEGSGLITQEQAHRLMSLSSERSRVPLEYLDSTEARAEACRQITEEIDKIWNEVFK